MSAKGLSKRERRWLETHVIGKLKQIGCKIFVFGSRARGDYKDFSDVDLLVEGFNPEDKEFRALLSVIREDLEDGNFPYMVDLVLDQNLARSYKKQIENEKIEWVDF